MANIITITFDAAISYDNNAIEWTDSKGNEIEDDNPLTIAAEAIQAYGTDITAVKAYIDDMCIDFGMPDSVKRIAYFLVDNFRIERA